MGKIIFAGAGSGDEELITIKLQKYLAIADVIITDRLVNQSIIYSHASANAIIHITGKEGFNNTSTPQEEINLLIVNYAKTGKLVLRLKGGDVAFFSNILDELTAAETHGIPYEIIPGITAASGASAYTGIPLTARNHSQAVHFIYFNSATAFTEAYWKLLATASQTLVIYMGASRLSALTENLLHAGIKKEQLIAIIENASTPQQIVHISTIFEVNEKMVHKKIHRPALIIIGDVVQLHHRFNWFAGGKMGSVFATL
jgi:uroporphyrin-III C-methyltransferase